MRRVTETILYLWLFIVACEAVIRYVLVEMGVPSLIYVKDILLIGLFLYFILCTITRMRLEKVLLTCFVLLLYGMLVGVVNGIGLIQVLFGVKMYLAFFVGFIAVYALKLERECFVTIFRFLVPVVLLGIVIELFVTPPWQSFEYEAYGVAIEGARQWSSFGIPRASGFGRTSFETAMLLFSLCTLFLIATLDFDNRPYRRARWFDWLLFFAAFVGVVITTAKTSILAFIMLFLFYVIARLYLVAKQTIRRPAEVTLKVLLVLMLLYGVIPPIVSAVAPSVGRDLLASDDLLTIILSASYIQRLAVVWPAAYALLSPVFLVLTGRGVGGIGQAQKYLEPELYNPGDNLYVYLLVDFGLVVLVLLLLYLLYKVITVNLNKGESFCFLFFCVALFTFGGTANVIESAPLMLTLGLLFGLWNRARTGRQNSNPPEKKQAPA